MHRKLDLAIVAAMGSSGFDFPEMQHGVSFLTGDQIHRSSWLAEVRTASRGLSFRIEDSQ